MEFNIISFLKTCGVCAKKRLSLETVFSILFTFSISVGSANPTVAIIIFLFP